MAQVKISQLPTAASVSSGDALPVLQNGVTKKTNVDGFFHIGNAYLYAPTYRTNAGDLSWTGIRAYGHVTTSSKSLEIFVPWAKATTGTWTAKEMSVVVRTVNGYPSARSGSSGGTYTALGASYADILDNGSSKRTNEVESVSVIAQTASGFLITINFVYALTQGSTTTAITNNTPISVTLAMTLTRA